ncbi:12213_t:CDS:2 [Dentiscutata heterogama]|uniref:12213_t:CDS:1 n=1 Tax=Dentiscutata heterogama TaxID=1316150 RepID=A0ACA9L7D6_9GLOM|nr:12213_t:CDS:2 [Dentiscutata heterogama]
MKLVSTSTLALSSSTSVISPRPFDNTDTIAKNAVGQKDAIVKIKEATQLISECEQTIKLIISEKRLGKLKHHAEAQAKLRAKKQKQLNDESIVEQFCHIIVHAYQFQRKHTIDYVAESVQHLSKRGRPQKQVDEISLATASSDFRVAEDVVDCNLSDDEILNLHDIQSDNEWELIDVRIHN